MRINKFDNTKLAMLKIKRRRLNGLKKLLHLVLGHDLNLMWAC